MKAPNITQGEWHKHGLIITGPIGDRIVDCNASTGKADAEKEANAQAVVALPELLAALKPFANFFKGDLIAVGGGTLVAPSLPLQVFKDAKAALVKAGYTF